MLTSPEGIPACGENTETTEIPANPETQAGSISDFEDMEKTMVLTGGTTRPDSTRDFDRMEKTTILSPQETAQPSADFFEEDDDLDKTMVIPPKTRH